MTTPKHDTAAEREAILAAMHRLLSGNATRSSGKLTIVTVAAEAGPKRHHLTHEHTDLRDLFNARDTEIKAARLQQKHVSKEKMTNSGKDYEQQPRTSHGYSA